MELCTRKQKYYKPLGKLETVNNVSLFLFLQVRLKSILVCSTTTQSGFARHTCAMHAWSSGILV